MSISEANTVELNFFYTHILGFFVLHKPVIWPTRISGKIHGFKGKKSNYLLKILHHDPDFTETKIYQAKGVAASSFPITSY